MTDRFRDPLERRPRDGAAIAKSPWFSGVWPGEQQRLLQQRDGQGLPRTESGSCCDWVPEAVGVDVAIPLMHRLVAIHPSRQKRLIETRVLQHKEGSSSRMVPDSDWRRARKSLLTRS